MRIPSALQPLLEDISIDTAGLLRMLRPGQLLRATVLSSTPSNSGTTNPAAGGVAQLRIGKATVTAQTSVSLETGQKLLLQVEKGLPEPLLRISTPAIRPPPAELLQQHAMARLIPPREVARQLQAVQQQLKQLPAAEVQRLPVVKQALQVLDPPLPDIVKLSPQLLRRATQDSGLLLEPRLFRQQEVPNADRKLQLLLALRQLQPEHRGLLQEPDATSDAAREKAPVSPQTDQLLNRLMRLIEGSIARIQSHQSHALANQDEPNRILWQVDLPLQVDGQREHVELKIRQEGDDTDTQATGHTWKVEVRFDFGDLGQVFSRITLQGKRLHCAFWSDRATTAARFEQALPRLERTLHDAGLEVSAVASLHGMPKNDDKPNTAILDERA